MRVGVHVWALGMRLRMRMRGGRGGDLVAEEHECHVGDGEAAED